MIESEIEKLEQRVMNLEVALHGLWALLKHLQPPDTQHDVDEMLAEHFCTGEILGGFRRSHIDIDG